MDLSGVIFVILALVWACYLIPRALRHHEEIAANRPVDSFSDTMRVLERTPSTMKALLTPPASTAGPRPAPASRRTSVRTRSRRAGSGPAVGTAAGRRRGVLGLLLLATAGTAGVAAYGYLTYPMVAVSGALVVGWLVLCRLMVRTSRRHRRRSSTVVEEGPRPSTVVEEGPLGACLETSAPVPADPVAELEDDGSLWDPLPLTLPTYVTKPAARRTVRTIDLTRTDVTSSGHDAADTGLVRAEEAGSGAPGSTESEPTESKQRKAAGA